MRLFTILYFIAISQLLQSQTCTEGQTFYYEDLLPGEYDLSWVADFGPDVAAWYGEHVVLLIEDEGVTDRDHMIMEQIVAVFDRLIEEFDLLTAHRPPHTTPWENRIRIDINYPKEGYGAGGANHFDLGIHASIEAFNITYNDWVAGEKTLDHVFFYELGRNYWFPLDRDPLQHDLNNPPHYQWVGGFNNFYPMVFVERLGLEDMTIGTSHLNDFIEFHLDQYEFYINSLEYDFNNTWTTDLFPWDQSQSLNILITAMLYDLYQEFGYEYIKELIAVLQKIPTPTDRKDHNQMISNWYFAVSVVAEKHMVDFFDKLKWSIPDEAIERVDTYLNQDDLFEGGEYSIIYEPFVLPELSTVSKGNGYLSPWSGNMEFMESSLTYPGIDSKGGSLILKQDDENEFRYERLLRKGSCGVSTYWLSYLIKAQKGGIGACMIELGGSKKAPIGKTWGDEFAIAQISTRIKMQEDEVYLIVARMDVREGTDDTYMWINIELDSEPDTEKANAHLKTNIGGIGRLNILYQSHGDASYVIDEIRVGENWEEISEPIENFIIDDMTTPTNDVVGNEQQEFLIYPNPVCGGCSLNHDTEFVIYDQQGRLVSKGTKAPLLSGVYFARSKGNIHKLIVID